MTRPRHGRARAIGAAAIALLAASLANAAASSPASPPASTPLAECHVPGIRNIVLCARLLRPLDPGQPNGAQISIRYVVVPALARRKIADPVFFLAGGPGQSAVGVASAVLPLLARLNNRRDLVFVDQRGTGGSAPLDCPETRGESLADQADAGRQAAFAAACKAALLKRPYIRSEMDLGFFTTWIAVQDLDAVRRALGVARVDLVGVSYGTRVALEYLRQFPGNVRRTVLDGVAPPDMSLPNSFSGDNERALDSLLAACAGEAACAKAHPDLRAHLAALLAGLPRRVDTVQPATGGRQAIVVSRAMVLGALRSALYVPALAAALPQAIDAAAGGDFDGLVGIATLFAPRKATALATGMHLSVVCSEDLPRPPLAGDSSGATFGEQFADLYSRLCAAWPRGPVPPEFYTLPVSASPVLLLSGGLDPATPPRHGARVARALGANARHVVVANAGHGVMQIGCMRDVVFRFIDAAADAQALAVDPACALGVPRPPAFQPPLADSPDSAELAR